MKKVLNFIKNPFYRVAGYTALVWGVAGIIVSTAIACGGDIHFHGLLHYGGASNEAIQQIVDSAKFDLRQEMGEMQLKQDHIDERAAQEYAQTSAKAQEWIQKIESALQGAGRFGNLVLMRRKRRRCVGNGLDDADYADLG